MNNPVTHETDFYAWLLRNAELIRQGQFSKVDRENIAEELEGMVRNDKRQLESRLAVLFAHLLKWEFQLNKRSNSWKGTIREQRKRILKLLVESPSLKNELENQLADAYDSAIIFASSDTGMSEFDFPNKCPFTIKKILDKEFLGF
ncbi:MAG: DUF29 domain-containing protein [Thiomargarita sp.]|nr:DUF29 domain-containing protein [Thiomargarita sp.]